MSALMIAPGYPMALPPQTGEPTRDEELLSTEFTTLAGTINLIGKWRVEEARNAIDLHDLGLFYFSHYLAIVASRFPAVATPLARRKAVLTGIDREVRGGNRGAPRRARESFAAIMLDAEGIFDDVQDGKTMQGFCWLQLIWDTSVTPWGLTIKPWPSASCYVDTWGNWWALTITGGPGQVGGRVPMRHGDGKWICVANGVRPHFNARIRVIAEPWMSGRYASTDQAALMEYLGKIMPMMFLPKGMIPGEKRTASGDATLSEVNVENFKKMLERVAAGVFTDGTSVKSLSGIDAGSAKLFTEFFAANRESIELAICGALSATASGTYVPIKELGVSLDVARDDVTAAERAFDTIGRLVGHYGWGLAAKDCPTYAWLLPDPKEAERQRASAEACAQFEARVKGRRELGAIMDQDELDALADQLGARRMIMGSAPAVARLDLAPTDLAKVITVDEARRSRGLPPIGDDRGKLTISELENQPGPADPVVAPPAVAPTPAPDAPVDPRDFTTPAGYVASRSGWLRAARGSMPSDGPAVAAPIVVTVAE